MAEGDAGGGVTGSLREAVGAAGRLLFEPFEAEKWLVLAFPAWLSILGISGMHVSLDGLTDEKWLEWAKAHPVRGWGAAGLAGAAMVAAGLAMAWLRARGLFVLLDCLVRSEVAVSGPWRRQAGRANVLFGVWVALSAPLVVLGVALGFGAAVWIRERGMDFSAMSAEDAVWLGCLAGVIVGGAAICWTVFLLVEDVLCVRLLRCGGGVFGALRECAAFVAAHAAEMGIYVLFRAVLALVACVCAVVLVCATCGVALVPYLGTAVMLPLHAVWRYQPLFFLRRLGWDAWEGAGVAPPPRPDSGVPPVLIRVPPVLDRPAGAGADCADGNS